MPVSDYETLLDFFLEIGPVGGLFEASTRVDPVRPRKATTAAYSPYSNISRFPEAFSTEI